MTTLKAPKLQRHHILALKNIIRLNYARAVRFKLEALLKAPEHPAETTSKLMTLADMLTEHDQPLTISMAMMEMYRTPEILIPMNDALYTFYSKSLATEIGAEDFRSVPEDKLADVLEPLKVLQGELRQRFNDAMLIDPEEIHRAAQAKVNLRAPTPKPTGLMN
jgi:hypothetical protein